MSNKQKALLILVVAVVSVASFLAGMAVALVAVSLCM